MEQIRPTEVALRYAQLPYHITVEEDECDGQRCYFAQVLELDGCVAQGETEEEARKNLDEVRVEYIQLLLDNGVEVPTPVPGVVMQATKGIHLIVPHVARIQLSPIAGPQIRPATPELTAFKP